MHRETSAVPRPLRTRRSSAWLLRWEWAGAHAALEDEIAAILPSRWGSDRVETAMWLLYHLRERTLSELADVARNSSNSVFKPQWYHGVAHMGGNPSLAAFQVKNLLVETEPGTRIETLRYTMPPLYQENEGSWPPERELVRGDLDIVAVRRRIGPLSSRRSSS